MPARFRHRRRIRQRDVTSHESGSMFRSPDRLMICGEVGGSEGLERNECIPARTFTGYSLR
jgi:hypothetical protein